VLPLTPPPTEAATEPEVELSSVPVPELELLVPQAVISKENDKTDADTRNPLFFFIYQKAKTPT
jgi:hypothetical protein